MDLNTLRLIAAPLQGQLHPYPDYSANWLKIEAFDAFVIECQRLLIDIQWSVRLPYKDGFTIIFKAIPMHRCLRCSKASREDNRWFPEYHEPDQSGREPGQPLREPYLAGYHCVACHLDLYPIVIPKDPNGNPDHNAQT